MNNAAVITGSFVRFSIGGGNELVCRVRDIAYVIGNDSESTLVLFSPEGSRFITPFSPETIQQLIEDEL